MKTEQRGFPDGKIHLIPNSFSQLGERVKRVKKKAKVKDEEKSENTER